MWVKHRIEGAPDPDASTPSYRKLLARWRPMLTPENYREVECEARERLLRLGNNLWLANLFLDLCHVRFGTQLPPGISHRVSTALRSAPKSPTCQTEAYLMALEIFSVWGLPNNNRHLFGAEQAMADHLSHMANQYPWVQRRLAVLGYPDWEAVRCHLIAGANPPWAQGSQEGGTPA